MLSLLALAAIALAAYGMGRPLLRGLRIEPRSPVATAVWSVSLGLVAGAVAWTALGLLGWLVRPVITAVTLLAGGWAIVELSYAALHAHWKQRRSRNEQIPIQSADRPPKWAVSGTIVLACVALAASLCGALAPPTAGDALCYHLQLPKVFLAEHALVYLPDCDNSTFPLLVEMLYLWALALDGPVAAQLVHWGLGLLLAGAALLLAEPVIGRHWSPLAGAVVLLVPGVSNQMTAPLADVGLATFSTLALAAWWRAVIDDHHPRWLLVAGIFCGAAWGTKYVALMGTAAVTLTWFGLTWHRRQSFIVWLRAAGSVALVAALVGGAWYVRAAVYRGNPVYPFFAGVFDHAGPPTIRPSKTPLALSVADVAQAPWTITMRPGDFGGRGHQLGGLFLLLLPGLWAARRLRGMRTLLAIAGLHFVLWCLLRQNARFLFPLVPLLAIPAVWVWMELRRTPAAPRYVVLACSTVLLMVGAAWPVYRARHTWEVAAGRESREQYLRRNEPTYAAAELANSLCPPEGRILSQEHRAFYFDVPVTRENLYRRRTKYDSLTGAPGQLSQRLREAGFSHILLAQSSGTSGIQYDPTLSRLVDRDLNHGRLARMRSRLEYEFTDADGATRRYRLLQLK